MEHLHIALALFEECGDDLLLAATLADSAGMHGEGDRELDAWALANVRRACEILTNMDAPNRYGHALHYLGILLRRESEPGEAAGFLALGATRLEDVGDANCWAGATRYLTQCEAVLGDPDSAARRLVAVIDRLPVLPMRDVHEARTMDTAVEIFLASGDHERAVLALGTSLAAELPAEYGRVRDPELEALRQRVVHAICESETDRLTERGAAMATGDAVHQIRRWLLES